MAKVLVTGGTSFIATHCIRQLLDQGYNVVMTVRSNDKGKKVVDALAPENRQRLSYTIVEDVAQKGAFDEAIRTTKDLDYVMHTASPFHYNVQDPVKDFLEPAVVGTTSILQAIKEYGSSVKRVVLTSSLASILGGSDKSPPHYDESVWNPVTWDEAVQNSKMTYRGSKTFAEKAAWKFMETEKPSFELVSINPALVFGPAAPHLTKGDLSGLNTSNIRILNMLQGKMKEKIDPTGLYSWVDVRDVAQAHVRALKTPDAAGKRFFLIAGNYTNKEIAGIIAKLGPEFEKNLPADIEASEDNVPVPEERYTFDNSRSKQVLGIQYASLQTSVSDTVESLLKLGAME